MPRRLVEQHFKVVHAPELPASGQQVALQVLLGRLLQIEPCTRIVLVLQEPPGTPQFALSNREPVRRDPDSGFGIEQLAALQNLVHELVPGRDSAVELVRSKDNGFQRYGALRVGGDPGNGHAPVNRPLGCLLDNQQVDVAVRTRSPACVGPEQHDPLGPVLVSDALGDVENDLPHFTIVIHASL